MREVCNAMTVIIKRSDAGTSRKYHTDICRVVNQIQDKQYWSKDKAEAWGYEECTYCAGEFENGSGNGRQTRRELLNTDMQVTLIQCTNSKRSEKSKAKNLYDESAYFRAMKQYANAKNDEWYILSAKHGLVEPETELEPYDEFGLSETQAADIAHKLDGFGVDVVEVVAGSKYTDPLIPELEARGIDVINNFAGLKIGERLEKLNIKTAELRNGSLC